jgi:hypothetical protein
MGRQRIRQHRRERLRVGRLLPIALWCAGALLGQWHAGLEPFVAHDEALPHVSGGHADRQPAVHFDAAELWRDHHCAACSLAAQRPLPAPGAAAAASPTLATAAIGDPLPILAPQPARGPGSPRAPPSLLA